MERTGVGGRCCLETGAIANINVSLTSFTAGEPAGNNSQMSKKQTTINVRINILIDVAVVAVSFIVKLLLLVHKM